ncbi:hypothetical protein HYQ46_012185 [Verticillium longisporum]|nr:hypothetical protein HYQ46_012185 [Verticillium longisporum]
MLKTITELDSSTTHPRVSGPHDLSCSSSSPVAQHQLHTILPHTLPDLRLHPVPTELPPLNTHFVKLHYTRSDRRPNLQPPQRLDPAVALSTLHRQHGRFALPPYHSPSEHYTRRSTPLQTHGGSSKNGAELHNEEGRGRSRLVPQSTLPKNRSTGNLALATNAQSDRSRVRMSFDAGAATTAEYEALARSPIVTDHDHGLGLSGLRRIRQQPSVFFHDFAAVQHTVSAAVCGPWIPQFRRGPFAVPI